MEKVFRGRKYDKPISIESASYKKDYRLLSKKEEAEYCKLGARELKIVSPMMELPPLLKEFVMKETGKSDVKMPVRLSKSLFSNSRTANEGEKPNFELVMGVGQPHPKSHSLYEGIKL